MVLLDRRALIDQAQVNGLSALYLGWKNNRYPRLTVLLASNNRMIDIAPHQYLPVDTSTLDYIPATEVRVIPRAVTYKFENGVMQTEVVGEGESFPDISITGDRPPDPPDPPDPPEPVLPPVIVPPNLVSQAKEVWIAHYDPSSTPANALIWSGDFFSNPGSPVYGVVSSLPADLTGIRDFVISTDGSIAYLSGVSSTNTERIWKGTSLKTSPIWTPILTYGDTIATGRTAKKFFEMHLIGITLSTVITAIENNVLYYAGYNGSSWEFYIDNASTETGSTFDGYYVTGAVDTSTGKLRTKSGVDVSSTFAKDGGTELASVWRNKIGGLFYTVCSQSTLVKVIKCDDASILFDTAVADGGQTENIYLSGTPNGTVVTFVLKTSGQLYYSTDGVAFAAATGSGSAWEWGKVLCANFASGLYLVWVRFGGMINGNEFVRLTQNAADLTTYPWTAATGNMWADTSSPKIITSGNLGIVAAGLVYD